MTTLDTIQDKSRTIHDVVDVRRHGDALVIPEGMTLPRVDAVIHARMDYESQEVGIHAPIEAAFPFESAYALFEVLTEKFGWANGVPTPGFFGPTPPQMLAVPVGPNKTVQVPWGRFALPNIEGYLQSSIEQDDLGVSRFVISGQVKRMYEKAVNEIVEAVKSRVRTKSIYKGKAFRVRLFDDRGHRLEMPEPKFIDLSTSILPELILPERTDASVKTNIFTPIQQTERVVKHGIPLKRGVLLAGPFGTGKTMIARATAEMAVANGWTYVEVERIQELSEVAKVIRAYGSREAGVVLFCEDIDRIMAGDERSIGIDQVLNVVDGVESKGSSMMIVLTTNELENITAAMLRPGRLDAIIHVGPPDAAAAERLARQYGRGLIPDIAPLTRSRELLAGMIPAVIREVVERSKLAAIRLHDSDDELLVDDDALVFAAEEMAEHVRLLTPKVEDQRSETVKAADVLATVGREAIAAGVPVMLTGVPATHFVPYDYGDGEQEGASWKEGNAEGHLPKSRSKATAVEAAPVQ